jgi:hypothetical protein
MKNLNTAIVMSKCSQQNANMKYLMAASDNIELIVSTT